MYVPDVKEKKYEKYLELFTTDVSMEKYLRSISDYICDENISPSNSDDIFFFKDIVFNTKFGKNHIFYYHWVCLDAQNSNKINYLYKYSIYLYKVSELFLIDFWHFLVKSNSQYVNNYFDMLDFTLKVKFAKVLCTRFSIQDDKQINYDKISLYIIF